MKNLPPKAVALIAILLAPTLLSTQAPPVAPQPTTIEGAAPHVYKTLGGVELRLHVFKTPRPAPNPAIVFFFGGGWTNGAVTQFVPQAKHLAERGMVAIVADYRVFDRHGTTPFEAMADAKSALRWVRTHSTELGVDSNRIVASGGSSGGHIALSAAIFDTFDDAGEDATTSSRPNVLVLFNPAVDTTSATPGILRERFQGRGEEGSPLHHVHPGLPPTLILHGTSDTTVPFAQVERFCTASKALGNECQLVSYEGATHSFFNPPNAGGKWYRETLLEADRFLTRIGYLPAPAPSEIR
jgi:acetyl esterase